MPFFNLKKGYRQGSPID